MKRKTKRLLCTATGVCLALSALGSFSACGRTYTPESLSEKTRNLTRTLAADASKRTGKSADFTAANLGFSTEFFKRSFRETGNTLVSPLSAAVVLAMLQNGAEGDTLSEMETVLGMPREAMNENLSAYMQYLDESDTKKTSLSFADSIWVRDAVASEVKENFLQVNKDYYDAEIYASPFDETTLKDVNLWTKNATEGMIDKILEGIEPEDFMYLINALYFEGEWEEKYERDKIRNGVFFNADGSTSTVQMMSSEENVYLSDESATGFIKPYKGGKLAFAALLPNEGTPISEYVNSLNEEKWRKLFEEGRTGMCVNCVVPAFSCEYETEASDVLKEMGMPSAFSAQTADFSGLMPEAYLGFILQKTRIDVDKSGTKAAAVTIGGMKCESAGEVVSLDRPFVYAIIDTENDYPLFLGAVTKL